MSEIDILNPNNKLALQKVIQFCNANLFSGKTKELDYLYGRGISDSTISQFKIGKLPKDVSLLSNFIGFDNIRNCGLAYYREGSLVSNFEHHSLMIPVYNVDNEPIAIIGRTLYSDKRRERLGIPKYKNTVYKKGSCLFGLNVAKDYIRKKGKVYVTEGNFDVISSHQFNHKNVVATSGTFLSKKQLILLSRYATDIQVIFDNDDAGKLATERVVKKYERYKNYGINIRPAFLPSTYNDLDDYLHKKLQA